MPCPRSKRPPELKSAVILVNNTWDAFAGWSDDQLLLIHEFERLLVEKNRRINLISRASANDIRRRHIEHCLTLALRDFPPGSSVVDWGTGGGLPGLPLAIRFPDVSFHLVDSIYKKTRMLEGMVRELGLANVTVHRTRAEDWAEPINYAVSRATASLKTLWGWTEPFLANTHSGLDQAWPPGLITLKGGDLEREIAELERLGQSTAVERILLAEVTGKKEFEDKYILSVCRKI